MKCVGIKRKHQLSFELKFLAKPTSPWQCVLCNKMHNEYFAHFYPVSCTGAGHVAQPLFIQQNTLRFIFYTGICSFV